MLYRRGKLPWDPARQRENAVAGDCRGLSPVPSVLGQRVTLRDSTRSLPAYYGPSAGARDRARARQGSGIALPAPAPSATPLVVSKIATVQTGLGRAGEILLSDDTALVPGCRLFPLLPQHSP